MKTTRLALLILTLSLLAFAAFAADTIGTVPTTKPQLNFTAHELSLDVFGSSTRADVLGAPNFGGGVGVNYFLTRGLGAGIKATTYNTEDAAVDDGEVRLIFRAPLWDRVAPYAFVSGFHNFDKDAWGAGAGGGLEVRLNHWLGFYGETGLRTTVPSGDHPEAAASWRTDVGLRIKLL